MPHLILRLLGPPQVLWGERPLPIRRRKARALLYYLAVEGARRPITRFELIDLLWGDAWTDARRRLNETLSRLRQGALPDPTLLKVQRAAHTVNLDRERVWVDLVAFQDQARPLVEKLNTWTGDGAEAAKVAAQWEQALSLWYGEVPFQGVSGGPGGVEFEHWMRERSTEVLGLRQQGLRFLAHYAWGQEDYGGAARWAMQAFRADPEDEAMLLLALKGWLAAGQPGRARAFWRETQRWLAERRLTVSPEMQEVVQRLLRQGGLEAKEARAVPWRVRPSLQAPLIGREQVLDRLHRAVRHRHSLALAGEPGQGKTTLLARVAQHWEPQREVLILTCRKGDQNLPLQPWAEALVHQIPRAWWARWPAPEQIAPLLTLSPELQALFPRVALPSFLSPEHMESLMNRALAAVLQALSRSRPLLLIVDDLHWADRATWGTLLYLLARPPFRPRRRASMLLTLRLEKLSPAQQEALHTLTSEYGVALEVLRPLDQAALAALAEHILERPPKPDEVEHLAQASGGNPFFALEVLRCWKERACGEARGVKRRPQIPSTVQELVRQRLDGLSPVALEALEAGALLGHDFPCAVLQHAFGWEDLTLAQAFQELEKHHLVVPGEEGQACYRFVHEVVREAVVQFLPPGRAKMLHRVLAPALEAVWGERAAGRAAVLAQHYQRGGEVVKAFHWWLQAGNQAIRLGARQEAYQAFGQAEALLQAHEDLFSDEEVWQLYSDWGDLAREVEDADLVERLSQALIAVGKRRRRAWLQGVGMDGLAEAALIRNDYARGMAYAQEAVALLRLTDHPFDLIEALTHYSVFHYMQGYPDEAIPLLQEAVALGEPRLHEPRVAWATADALYELGVCLTFTGQVHQAEEQVQRAVRLYERVRRPYGHAGALNLMALVHFFMGGYRQAIAEANQALEELRELFKWRQMGYAHLYRSMSSLALGKVVQAWQAAQEALRIGQEHGHPEVVASALRLLGDIFAYLDSWEQALAFYTQAYEVAGDSFATWDVTWRVALARAALGQPESAAFFLGKMAREAASRQVRLVLIPVRLALGFIALTQGALDSALEQIQSALRSAREHGLREWEGWGYVLRGRVAQYRGKVAEARKWYRRTLAQYRQVPNFWFAFWALEGLRRTQEEGSSEAVLRYHLITQLQAQLDGHQGVYPFESPARALLARLAGEG